MKLLIDIDEKLFREVSRLTRAKTKKEAIVIPMQEYLKQQNRKALAQMIGNYQISTTLPQLKKQRNKWKNS